MPPNVLAPGPPDFWDTGRAQRRPTVWLSGHCQAPWKDKD